MSSVQHAIDYIASKWEADMFENGDCHTLAMALHQAFDREGTLWACLRKSVDDEGISHTTTYSHMIFVDRQGTSWDIEGAEADERWDERFDLENPDKWGLMTELEWVIVPSLHPQYSDTHIWLQEHYGCINTTLQDQLVQEIRQALAKGT
jgi:hypothetical protein